MFKNTSYKLPFFSLALGILIFLVEMIASDISHSYPHEKSMKIFEKCIKY